MFSPVSAFRIGSRFKPLDVFKLLCSVTFTGTSKKESISFKFSICVFLVVSTSNVPFFSFTDLAMPIAASICFSITNGETEVIVFFCSEIQ